MKTRKQILLPKFQKILDQMGENFKLAKRPQTQLCKILSLYSNYALKLQNINIDIDF